MAITTISEGITPVRMLILNPKSPTIPSVKMILIPTTTSELATTFIDRKNRNRMKAAIRIESNTKRKSSCWTVLAITVRIEGRPD